MSSDLGIMKDYGELILSFAPISYGLLFFLSATPIQHRK